MKKVILMISMFLVPALNARSQNFALPNRAESDFSYQIQRGVATMKPNDPFEVSSCKIVDAKFFAPLTLDQAQRSIAPCLDSISKKYGVQVTAKTGTPSSANVFTAQVQVLVLDVARPLSIVSPLVRDLNYGLAQRRGHLLGLQATLYVPGREMSASEPIFHANSR